VTGSSVCALRVTETASHLRIVRQPRLRCKDRGGGKSGLGRSGAAFATSLVDDSVPERMLWIGTRVRRNRGCGSGPSSPSPLLPSPPEFEASPDSSTDPDAGIVRTPARKQFLLPGRARSVILVGMGVGKHHIERDGQQRQKPEWEHDQEADRQYERHQGPEIPWHTFGSFACGCLHRTLNRTSGPLGSSSRDLVFLPL
jgi:hypothetical protein